MIKFVQTDSETSGQNLSGTLEEGRPRDLIQTNYLASFLLILTSDGGKIRLFIQLPLKERHHKWEELGPGGLILKMVSPKLSKSERFIKEVQELSNEKFKTSREEIEEDTRYCCQKGLCFCIA